MLDTPCKENQLRQAAPMAGTDPQPFSVHQPQATTQGTRCFYLTWCSPRSQIKRRKLVQNRYRCRGDRLVPQRYNSPGNRQIRRSVSCRRNEASTRLGRGRDPFGGAPPGVSKQMNSTMRSGWCCSRLGEQGGCHLRACSGPDNWQKQIGDAFMYIQR